MGRTKPQEAEAAELSDEPLGAEVGGSWAPIPGLSPTGPVTLGRSLYLRGPQFPQL